MGSLREGGTSAATAPHLARGIASAVAFAFFQAWYTITAKVALLEGIPPLIFGSTIMGIACILICSYLGGRGRLGELKQRSSSLTGLLKIGLTGTAINVFGLYGLRLTSASNAAILTRTDLLFAILLARLMLGERLSLGQLFAAGIMLLGALRVVGFDSWGHAVSEGQEAHLQLLGDLLIVASAFFLGLNACQIKRQMLCVSGEVVAAYNTGVMWLLCLLGSLFAGETTSLPPLAARHGALILANGCILFFFFLLYYFSLSQLPAWATRAFVLLSPAVVLGLSAPLLHEAIRAQQVHGMLLVVVGGVLMALFLGGARGQKEDVPEEGQRDPPKSAAVPCRSGTCSRRCGPGSGGTLDIQP